MAFDYNKFVNENKDSVSTDSVPTTANIDGSTSTQQPVPTGGGFDYNKFVQENSQPQPTATPASKPTFSQDAKKIYTDRKAETQKIFDDKNTSVFGKVVRDATGRLLGLTSQVGNVFSHAIPGAVQGVRCIRTTKVCCGCSC